MASAMDQCWLQCGSVRFGVGRRPVKSRVNFDDYLIFPGEWDISAINIDSDLSSVCGHHVKLPKLLRLAHCA